MAGLMFDRGELLFVDGALAFCETDCCYGAPPPCEDCCTKLRGGTWVPADSPEPAYFLFEFHSTISDDLIEVKVEGVLQDRIICNGDEVTFNVAYKHHEAEGSNNGHGEEEPNHLPFITWDRAWEYQSIIPGTSIDDEIFPYGMIRFGAETDIHSYQIKFKFNACYIGGEEQYGAIDFVWDNESIAAPLRFVDCVTAYGDCCVPEFSCLPCCFYVPTTDGNTNIDKSEIVYWAESASTRVRLAFVVDSDDRVIFCRDTGGEIIVKVDVIPSPENNDGVDPTFCIYWQDWWKGAFPDGLGDPPCPPESDADCDNQDWHSHHEGFSNSISFVRPGCDHPCGSGTFEGLTFEMGLITIETEFLEECPGTCCCDEYVTCCSSRCWYDIDIVEQSGPGPNSHDWTTSGPFTIENYEMTVVSGVNSYVYTQNQSAIVTYDTVDVSLDDCPELLKARISTPDTGQVYVYTDVTKNGVPAATDKEIVLTICMANDTQAGCCGDADPGFDETIHQQTQHFEQSVSDVNIPKGTGFCSGRISFSYTDPLGAEVTVSFDVVGVKAYPSDLELRCQNDLLQVNENGVWRNVLKSEIDLGEGEDL